MNTALILVDIQNDYFKNGKSELYKPEEAAANAKIALNYFRDRKLPVFHVRHINTNVNGKFFLPDTTGSEIYIGVTPLDNEKVIIKHRPSSFYKTQLQECLEKFNIEHLVICGMMSHMCIDTTVRAAKNLDYTITLLHDACTTKNLSFNDINYDANTVHNVFMSALKGFATVISTDEFIKQ